MTEDATRRDLTDEATRDAIMAKVRAFHLASRRDADLDERLEYMFARNKDDDPDAQTVEARAIVLVGETGAGKTRAIKRFLRKRFPNYKKPGCVVASIKVRAPCTLASLGRLVLKKIGYELRPSKNCTADEIWEMVDNHFTISPVRYLHFDEMQTVTRLANKKEAFKIRERIKSFLNDEDMPIGLILVGLPELATFLEEDGQEMRRSRFVSFDPVTEHDTRKVCDALTKIAGIAGLNVEPQSENMIASRLMHDADYQLGRIFEIVCDVIELALIRRQPSLTSVLFADDFAARTGNKADANPYLSEDWRNIDTKRVLLKDARSQPSQDPKTQKKKPKPDQSYYGSLIR